MHRRLVALLLLAFLIGPVGCAGVDGFDQKASTTAETSAGQLPDVEAIPEPDWIDARLACKASLPDGANAGDLRVVSSMPKIPQEWWLAHAGPPYKMIHLRLDVIAPLPAAIDYWPAVESADAPWTCSINSPAH